MVLLLFFAVDLLFIVTPVAGVLIVVFLLYDTLCPFYFCNHIDVEERAGCFAWLVFLVSSDCCVGLLRGAMGLSVVFDCDIYWSYSLFLLL